MVKSFVKYLCLLCGVVLTLVSCSKGDGSYEGTIILKTAPIDYLLVGESMVVKVEITPADLKVEFKSEKPNVATVNSNGIIKAVGEGTTDIIISAVDNPSIAVRYRLTVKPIYTAPANTGFKQVGYIPYYRTVTASGIPDSKLKMMDVVCYAFAHINETTLMPEIQEPSKLKTLVTRCKSLGVKCVLSFGVNSKKSMVKMAQNKETRDKFADELIKMVKQYNLDGLDNDWEYPSTSDGSAQTNLELMKRLSAYCHDPANNKLLTMAITPAIYMGGYAEGVLDALHQYVDWYNVMVYGWAAGESEIGMYPTVMSKLEKSYNYYINTRKMPTSKYLTGIGCYGNPSGISSSGRTLTYASIVNQDPANSQKNEAVVVSSSHPGQPFTIYYDGQPLVAQKTTWSMERNLGGMMYWEVSQDKHNEHSLIKASNDAQGRSY